MMRKLFIGIVCSFLSLHGFAQEDLGFSYIKVREIDSQFTKIDRYSKKHYKAKQYSSLLDELRTQCNNEGFVLHRLQSDTINDTLFITVELGKSYRWSNLESDEIAKEYMRKAGIRVEKFSRKAVSAKRIGTAFNRTLRYCENHGFPFASIKIDSVSIVSESVAGIIKLELGPYTTIDSLVLVGDLDVREGFIAGYTGLKEGSAYNEQRIRGAAQDLDQVPFIVTPNGAQVQFNESATKVILQLNKERASRFDGIVGFLPDENTGELLITGDVSIHLENSLKQGEVFDLKWRRLQSNTQDLEAITSFPFVFDSPFGPDARLKIYRRDTTFTDVFGQAGIRYIFSRNNYVRAFVDQQVTNLISTSQYENTLVIPEYLDRSITSYGLGIRYAKLDYMLNPAKGIIIDVDGAVGTKRIIENADIPQAIYDSLELNSVQFRTNGDIAYFVSVVPRLVWHQRFLGGSILNNQVFNNEATRIGGLKTLRGFNEEAIFATSYMIARNELRYQIERNGYLFLLFDGAWYENMSLNHLGARRDTPYAFGLGITLGTKAGIFSLSAAAGSEQGNPLLIRSTKFHFGFLSIF